jgi:GNAT superfamily N-acetyltransferase
MQINIRRAERKDCARLLELIKELAEYEKAPQEVTVTQEHFEESGFGANPVWWAFVAEYNGRVEGFALYYIRYSTWKGQCLYLEDFLVTEALRGRGMGKLLFDRVIQETRDRGLKRMVGQVLDWNEPALRFYRQYNPILDPEWVNGILDV